MTSSFIRMMTSSFICHIIRMVSMECYDSVSTFVSSPEFKNLEKRRFSHFHILKRVDQTEIEMNALSEAIGVPVQALTLVGSLFASYPLAFIHRQVYHVSHHHYFMKFQVFILGKISNETKFIFCNNWYRTYLQEGLK